MNVEELEKHFQKKKMNIVQREDIHGTKVLFAEGLDNNPPLEAGIRGSAYRTAAAWEIDGEYKRYYEEYYQWGEKGGFSHETKVRIASVREKIKEALKKDRIR